ncbi:hypothetical protein [Spiroplasma eriocheiris]|uniref:Uncharacterized protein n=1 Tax=Spiroplasma eriocheiris TaxID=315358 RepID=A0A0H3XHT8_9MOLU|nr:hypothetical protein [Spiroplasma eriocheiris]AHF57496.1 hypothetical protein SPE_0367 [Spiroplasma eriocheiris CCTCC M 207170]AKM53955.1 hypothetical protein SERIO_v1c03730 [Spiroplasma eriocheiris]
MFNFTTIQKWIIYSSLIGFTLIGAVGGIVYAFHYLTPAIVLLSIAGIGLIVVMIMWFIIEAINKRKNY